jgi:gliding motility-associated-like protein
MDKEQTIIRKLIGLFLFLVLINPLSAQIYNIETEDGNSVSTCSGIFTDSDAFSDDAFLNNEDFMVTFCSDQTDECLTIDFTSFDVGDPQDWLYVWDGADTATGEFVGAFNNPFGNNTNNILTLFPNGIQSVSGCFTFYFHSDSDFITGSGWEANISCYDPCVTCSDGIQNGTESGIDCGGACADCPEPIYIDEGGTVTTCGSSFTDSGGFDQNYSNNESNTITICADNPNPAFCISALFTEFSVENNWDYLFIYDGNSVNAPVIGGYTGTNSPGEIIGSGSCLTFFFTSDFQISNFPGWVAEISCGDCADEPVPSYADCVGALALCEDVQNADTPSDGAGNVSSEIPANNCFMTEVNVIWYIFDVESDGIFNFTLDADAQSNGDYDWVVYDITGLSCDDLSDAEDVSCNTWGLPTGTLVEPTGISTANGGIGTSNGPGNFNGPPFNEDLDVETGDTYVLVISNCCNATAGFEIDFSASTAEIYDAYDPIIDDVSASCANNQVTVTFNELIDCTSISEVDFEIIGPNGSINILSASAEWCDNGNEGTNTIELYLDEVLDENENYTFSTTDIEDGVADLCGNTNTNESFDFSTSTSLTIAYSVTPSDCAAPLPNGTAQITVEGGIAPYYVEIGSQNDYDVDVFFFDELNFGVQQVEVYDLLGCHATFFLDIPSSNSLMDNEVLITNVSCAGGDGFFEVNTSGGVGFGPWNYLLTDTLGTEIASALDTSYFLVENLDVSTYLLSVTDQSGLSSCADLQEIVIGQPDSILLHSTSDTTVCYNGQAELSAYISSGYTGSPFTIYWESDTGNFTSNENQIIPSATLTSSESYLVYAQDDLGCYSDTLTVNVVVADLLSFEITPDQVICPETALDLEVSNISGGYGLDYTTTWILEDGTAFIGNILPVQPDSITSYCVTVGDICETPDVDTCVTVSPSLSVPVTFSIDSDTSSCPPYLATFTNTTDPSLFESATWYFGDGNQSNDLVNTNNIYTFSGNFNVALSLSTAQGCVFDTIVENAITIFPVPNPYFVMYPQIATLQNTTIDFNNQTVGASSYYWIFDTINNLGESYDENPTFTFPDLVADNYYVKLTAYNVYGCESSLTQLLIVREDQTLYVPNSFTPNGDGDNDYFFVQGVELDPNAFSLIIFDRWGGVVYESTDLYGRWNGSVKGSDYYAQPGVYVYHLSYQVNGTLAGEQIVGSVTLLK